MTAIEERIETERRFHDQQAASRFDSFVSGQAALRFDDATYLDHETWIRPAFALLGNLHGKRVLDYGCGHGMASVVMARRGATVTAFDLSPGYVNETRQRAAANCVSVTALVADGEKLPFPDASFDAIWGCAILHHLDLRVAAREIRRVLVPGGLGVFCEPWGGNPLLRFSRRFLPYPGKHRTPDERPLLGSDLPVLRETFPKLQWQGYQLLGMLRRVGLKSPLVDRTDGLLIRIVPGLQHWSRYVVVELRKNSSTPKACS
ncbi:hypothetical protein BH11PLA2_BH11PLA2_46240 [soil metagenome]